MKNKFYEVSDSKYHNKEIHLRCVVSGKSLAPYCIPKKLKITTRNIEYIYKIKAQNENILKFIDISSLKLKAVLKGIFNLTKFKYEVLEVQNIERIFILPPVGKERNKLGTIHIAYFIGYGLDINTLYDMRGYTTVDPTNQITTHVFTLATKLKSDVATFTLTEDLYNNLQKFCIEKPTVKQIFKHLENLYMSYSHNITKIYDRFDLHLVIDLAFRSVISFKFDNELVHKGWLDVIVIGDTRCGKGYVAEKLIDYFGIGEIVSGDNISFSGLVGGLQQFNGHWVVTWGKIPLNDCGLLIIDEASEIKDADWSRLSRIRSEGIAEVTKIHSQSTNARTRLIFLCNPPQKTISNYSYGVQSILDVVKSPEDIARFDYALVVAHDEVDMRDINKPRSIKKSLYTHNLEQNLILWLWSRKTDEIIFSQKAIALIYRKAVELANIYSFDIPLVQGENIRIKLAKLSIAFAGRLFSNKKKGKILFVDVVHVLCATNFLNLIYKKDSCGYLAYSRLQKYVNSDNKLDIEVIEKYFNAYRNKIEIYKYLLIDNVIALDSLSEYLNQPKEIAKEIISILLQKNCVIRKGNSYVKTPTFTLWLKSILIGEMTDGI